MKIFKKILPLVTKRWESPGSVILAGKHRVPLGKEHFKLLAADHKPLTAGNVKLGFVDSGSGDVFKTPAAHLSFFRLYASVFQGNKRMKSLLKELFIFISGTKKEGLVFEAKVFNREGDELAVFDFDAFDPYLSSKSRRVETPAVLGVIRRVLEIRLCAEIANDLDRDDCVVRDGDLEASHPYVQEALVKLSTRALEKNIHILGLSKTSTLTTDAGVSALAALHNIAPGGRWVYDAGLPVRFVRLHERSKYIFRLDAMTKAPPLDALAANSVDLAFLGYPFGLLDADKFAQVTKSEAKELQLRFAMHSKEVLGVVERAVDAHDILDLL